MSNRTYTNYKDIGNALDKVSTKNYYCKVTVVRKGVTSTKTLWVDTVGFAGHSNDSWLHDYVIFRDTHAISSENVEYRKFKISDIASATEWGYSFEFIMKEGALPNRHWGYKAGEYFMNPTN